MSQRRSPFVTSRLVLALALALMGSLTQAQEPALRDQILKLLARAGEPLTRAALRSALHVNNQRLGDALERLGHLFHAEKEECQAPEEPHQQGSDSQVVSLEEEGAESQCTH